jgi:hypothetical protein
MVNIIAVSNYDIVDIYLIYHTKLYIIEINSIIKVLKLK